MCLSVARRYFSLANPAVTLVVVVVVVAIAH